MAAAATPALFRPIEVGKITLSHRVVMSPLTRFKATEKEHVPLPIMKTYYTQRASTPGTLIITEATFIAPKAGGYTHVPGIWSDEQVKAWKEITDAVHSKGCFTYMQLWALGRAAVPAELHAEDPSLSYVSASDIPLSEYPSSTPAPRPLTVEEIREYVELFAAAASNAIKAGFDGVEIHAANGYLPDQFLQDVSNKRTDEYGGSVENRCRFTLEVADSIANAVGAERLAIRLSPWSVYQDMCMKDPKPTFSYLINQLKERHPDMSYIHVIEPRIKGNATVAAIHPDASNDFLREIWAPRPYISAGAHERDSALQFAEKGAARASAKGDKAGELIAFGRHFLANPDLPIRLEKNIPLNPHDRSLFYVRGDTSGNGYTNYTFSEEEKRESER